VAMLAPVMLQAKEAAKMRVCISSLRELGLAINRYIDDNSGYGLPCSPIDSLFKNPWILYVKPLLPDYIAGSKGDLANEIHQPNQQDWDRARQQPKRIWICPGDVYRGAREQDMPFWFYCGSSYMYPGPTAYMVSQSNPDMYMTKVDVVPRKPLTWRNHSRDLLLADNWFDFHNGRRVNRNVGDYFNVNPPMKVPPQEVKCMDVLFLDTHVQTVTPVQRTKIIENTVKWDNPYVPAPKQ
ncbi:MAG: hypothetical protein M1133_13400, partial [Armatimonadetes bacterium]|nr:hypothetical protein [Armatimonadota bacterium]